MRFLATSLLTLTLSSFALAGPVSTDEDSFHVLARDADDSALHAALHAKKEYKHGIFPHDRHALEAVRRDHEEEALKIVKFALMRRQDNSTTTTTTTTTSSSSSLTSRTTTDTTTTTGDETPTSTTTIITTTRTFTETETATETETGTETSEVELTPTTFTTTRVTVITDDEGEPSTVTRTDIVIVTPTGQDDEPTSSSTGPPSLQTPDHAGKVELGWVHVGMAVAAGVGGWML